MNLKFKDIAFNFRGLISEEKKDIFSSIYLLISYSPC